jgi:hypothetical protein
MGSNDRPGKGYTAPKGQQTSAQGDTEEKAPRISATVEWVIVGVVLVGLVVVAFMFASGSDSTSPHGGAPAPYVEPLVVDQI